MQTKNSSYSSLTIEELLDIRLDILNKNSTEEEKDIIVEKFYQHYRSLGFPYYDMSEDKTLVEYRKFHNYSIDRLILNDDLEMQQVMLGLNIVNNYHPQMWSVKCRDRLSPMEVYMDDDLFRKALRKRLKMSDSKMALFNVRKSLKIFSGAQSVSNFKPTIAKYLYNTYCDKDSIVLDPCMGYGGRLLGASKDVKTYVGVDPSKETYENNIRLSQFLNSKCGSKTNYDLYNEPFEDVFFNDNYFDFIFTSPPYFNVEKYSYEDNQSWVRYSEYNTWVEYFLKPLIENSYKYLKQSKFFAINVHGDDIIEDVLRISGEVGFKLEKTYKMRLSKICGKGQDKSVIKFKHEPIFLFKK